MTDPRTHDSTAEQGALLRQALRALEQMKLKVRAAEQRMTQPIAIVGMGCRFPGGIENTQQFWQLLKEGRRAITEVPADRWSIEDYYDPDVTRPGKMVSRWGGFLDQVDEFDAAFFGIAPREAAMMDPQQRLVLEVAWQALEDAGIAPHGLKGSRTGLYLGMASGDYAQLQLQADHAELLDVHYASGNAHSIASGRLSYLLGLHGPSLTVDTACSSSLVAIHLACQALRSGECTLAIAGGVNVMLAPETTVALSQAHMLAPDGHCKVFDDRADGFTRAEGCGMLILKPLNRAQEDGDRILAVIRGTATNQDGASSSLTAPHGPSQEELMRRALLDAHMDSGQVGYVETHGTGTSLGDPIELRALGAVYGARRAEERPLWIGSLKTNLGHMEAAAGVGGMIKLVLALQHGEIPAHLDFTTPTRHVDWQKLKLAVPTVATPWKSAGDASGKVLRRAGAVSSFGFSGTNAHLIVEEAPSTVDAGGSAGQGSTMRLLPLSAQSYSGLQMLAAKYEQWLSSQADTEGWADIAGTAAMGRDHLRYRLAFVASSSKEAATQLAQWRDQQQAGQTAGPIANLPVVGFLFTGQGSEHSGMGLDLLKNSQVFRTATERMDAALSGILDKPLSEIWRNAAGELQRASYVQPALYAYGWALSELWRSRGVEPEVVLGHSLGDYVAATIANVMTPEEGMRLVAARGRLTEQYAEPGSMLGVLAEESMLRDWIVEAGLGRDITVAAVNAPANVVISGRRAAVDAFEAGLKELGLRCRRLTTTHGFHSPAIDAMLDAFEAEAQKVEFRVPDVRWISNVTGSTVGRDKPVDAGYWRHHMREAVQFSQAVRSADTKGMTVSADTKGMTVFVEVGALPQLSALAGENGIETERIIPSIAKIGPEGEWAKTLQAAGKLYVRGVELQWKALVPDERFRRLSLPGYPFQRQRYWFTDGRVTAPHSQAGVTSEDHESSGHPLLQQRVRSSSSTVTFHAELSAAHAARLGEHVVNGERILPGAAYLEMALAAMSGTASAGMKLAGIRLMDVSFREPCVFDQPRLLETLLQSSGEDGRRAFSIASAPLNRSHAHETGAEWTIHATGSMEFVAAADTDRSRLELETFQESHATVWNQAGFYRRFEEIGLAFGSAFRTVKQAWSLGDESLVALEFDATLRQQAKDYKVHPVALDACLQAAAALSAIAEASSPALPASVESLHLFLDPATLAFAHAKVRRQAGRSLIVDIQGLDAEGRCVLAVTGLALVAAAGQQSFRGWLHAIEWQLEDEPAAPAMVEGARPAKLAMDKPRLNRVLEDEAKHNRLQDFARWTEDFDAWCAARIVKGFEDGGFAWIEGRRFTLDELIAVIRIVPEHHRLAGRLLAILVAHDYASAAGPGTFVAKIGSTAALDRLARTLAVENHPEFAWTDLAAAQMVPLLRGSVHPVHVLFSEEGKQIATRLYRESVVARSLNPVLAAAAVEAAAQCPGGARVLEVGGGTGSATSYLIPALQGNLARYVWTDLGAAFVSAARQEFGSADRTAFQVLDLEKDPTEQGLEKESFDILIASNVIHATADLKQTLHRVRSMLRPGGVLLLAETTGRQPWIDMTVGFTEGWWRFTDSDVRPEYPLMSKQTWAELLHHCGFEAVHLVPEQENGVLGHQCVMTAVRAVEQADVLPNKAQKALLITASADASPTRKSLEAMIEAESLPVTAIAAEAVTTAWMTSWLTDGNHGRLNIVYLPALEIDALTETQTGEEAFAWQDAVLGGAVRTIQAVLGSNSSADVRVWLVTRAATGLEMQRPEGATLAALARSARAEHPGLSISAVDMADAEPSHRALWQLVSNRDNPAPQYRLDGAGVSVPRLVPKTLSPQASGDRNKRKEAGSRRLRFGDSGVLEEMMLEVVPAAELGAMEVEIAISAVPINFHEVLDALSTEASEVPPGGECAGVITRIGEGVRDIEVGTEVLAIGTGLMADHARLLSDRLWVKPATLTQSEAATLIVPFVTARWSLEKVAHLQPGERVLIHSAAGGVGLAAIQEARRLGATVLATAGSDGKRAYLRSLGVEHVFDSRTGRFEQEVLVATAYQGVDVVLNALSGDRIAAGLRCLAPGGRFVELGEKGVLSAAEASAIRPDARYQRVHLRSVLNDLPPEMRTMIDRIVDDAGAGRIAPLPVTTYPLDDAATAFRYMASGQHIGRVLLLPAGSAALAAHKAKRGFPGFRADGAYVVTGGCAGLGLLTVEWLARHKAGCVIAISRSAPDAETRARFQQLESGGTRIVWARCDVGNNEELADALQMIPAEYGLRGIFHAAGVLEDGSLQQQSMERFRPVLNAKIAGAWNLHRCTAGQPLDCFVMFSSAAGVLGSRGQANHAAANAYLDALAHYRRSRGETALSVAWGAWSGTGAAVRHGVLERSERAGASSIAPASGFALLHRLMEQDVAHVLASRVDWNQWAAYAKNEAAANRDLLQQLLAAGKGPQNTPGAAMPSAALSVATMSSTTKTQGKSWSEKLLAADLSKRSMLLQSLLEDRIRAVLSMPAGEVLESARPLQEYGLDSLLSIELVNRLSLEAGRKLPATTLFDYPTLAALTRWLAGDVFKLGEAEGGTVPLPAALPGTVREDSAGGETGGTALLDGIAAMSEEEIERIFQQKMAGISN